MNRSDVLETAGNLINGDRQEDYGDAADNFSAIAAAWTLYLSKPITAHDVAMMMTLLKVMRIKNGKPKSDSYVDCAGYIALACELRGIND